VKTLSPPAAKISEDGRSLLQGLGLTLRAARTRRGLTREQLAVKLLLSRNTLQRIESGDPAVSMGYYLAAAEFLGVAALAPPDLDAIIEASGVKSSRARARQDEWC